MNESTPAGGDQAPEHGPHPASANGTTSLARPGAMLYIPGENAGQGRSVGG
jgi:hypothetical protein